MSFLRRFTTSAAAKAVNSGSLLAKVKKQATVAAAAGAVQAFPISAKVLPEEGIPFVVFSAKSYPEKPQQPLADHFNPFFPHDPALFVENCSATHKVLLNKFYLHPSHLLVCTKNFEKQTEPLNAADFHAMWHCVSGVNGLAFFNFGKHSGGHIEPHRHIQVFPLPLLPDQLPTPLDLVISNVSSTLPARQHSAFRLPQFKFRHAICTLPPVLPQEEGSVASALMKSYTHLLEFVGADLAPADPEGKLSYNVLLTQKWMMVVRRSAGAVHNGALKVNAVSFAGSVFASTPEQLALIEQTGVLKLLQEAATPL